MNSTTGAQLWLFTCYEDRGLQCDPGPSDAAAHTRVGPRVLLLDLWDQQRAVGKQEQTVDNKQSREFHFQLGFHHR